MNNLLNSISNCLRHFKDALCHFGLYLPYVLICYKIVRDIKITTVEYTIVLNAEKYE
jgi:hypothetical protein